MKIPHKYAQLLFALLMSVLISGMISFVMTILNIGLGPGFVAAWLTNMGQGFIIAFPVSYFATKPLRTLVAWMTD